MTSAGRSPSQAQVISSGVTCEFGTHSITMFLSAIGAIIAVTQPWLQSVTGVLAVWVIDMLRMIPTVDSPE